MNPATRARLVDLLWSGRCPAGAVVPELVLHGETDFPAWALEILLLTEETEEDLKSTDVVYRACGRCDACREMEIASAGDPPASFFGVPEPIAADETEPTKVEEFVPMAKLPPLSPSTVDVSYEDGAGGVPRLSRPIRCF